MPTAYGPAGDAARALPRRPQLNGKPKPAARAALGEIDVNAGAPVPRERVAPTAVPPPVLEAARVPVDAAEQQRLRERYVAMKDDLKKFAARHRLWGEGKQYRRVLELDAQARPSEALREARKKVELWHPASRAAFAQSLYQCGLMHEAALPWHERDSNSVYKLFADMKLELKDRVAGGDRDPPQQPQPQPNAVPPPQLPKTQDRERRPVPAQPAHDPRRAAAPSARAQQPRDDAARRAAAGSGQGAEQPPPQRAQQPQPRQDRVRGREEREPRAREQAGQADPAPAPVQQAQAPRQERQRVRDVAAPEGQVGPAPAQPETNRRAGAGSAGQGQGQDAARMQRAPQQAHPQQPRQDRGRGREDRREQAEAAPAQQAPRQDRGRTRHVGNPDASRDAARGLGWEEILNRQQQRWQQRPPRLAEAMYPFPAVPANPSCCGASTRRSRSAPNAVSGVFVGVPVTALPVVGDEGKRHISWPVPVIWNVAYQNNVDALKALLKEDPSLLDAMGYLKTKPTAEIAEAQRLGIRLVTPDDGRGLRGSGIHGVLPAPVGDDSRGTPLHFAVLGGAVDVVAYLLKKGASLDIPSQQGSTALFIATHPEKPAVVSAIKREVQRRREPKARGILDRIADLFN